MNEMKLRKLVKFLGPATNAYRLVLLQFGAVPVCSF